MRKLATLFVLALTVSSCGAVSSVFDGWRQAGEAAAALEKSTGMKPDVGFNWHNGRLLSVTVVFPQLPTSPSVQDLAAATQKAVAASFKQTPETIVFGFDLPAARAL